MYKRNRHTLTYCTLEHQQIPLYRWLREVGVSKKHQKKAIKDNYTYKLHINVMFSHPHINPSFTQLPAHSNDKV